MVADPTLLETIMNSILSSLTAFAVAAPLAAFAAEPTFYYPRLPGDADNLHVEYAPGSNDNVVGGGLGSFRGGDAERPLFNDGPGRTQPPASAPVFVGVDDGRPVFSYAPAQRAATSALAARTSPRS